jgi:hypothetical protein
MRSNQRDEMNQQIKVSIEHFTWLALLFLTTAKGDKDGV